MRGTPFFFCGKTMDKATRIDLFSMRSAPMRAFHLTWMAFFVCFFAWFACAPLMPLIKREYGLTADQVANINIAAVAVTILVRLVVGPMCDRFGPRKVYSALLLAGSRAGARRGALDGLRQLPVVPSRDRRDRRELRHHAVPHVGDVRAERRRHRERDDGRLGQRRRGRRAGDHSAASSRRRSRSARARHRHGASR